MRILAIVVLTLTLVGCTGDRVKQGMKSPQDQSKLGLKAKPHMTRMYGPAARCKRVCRRWLKRSCKCIRSLRLEHVLRAIMDISSLVDAAKAHNFSPILHFYPR